MLAASSLPGESGCEGFSNNAIALGLSRRWPWQQIGRASGVEIAVDADLYNLEELAKTLAREGFHSSKMSLAETLANLYLQRGTDFVQLLQGAFSIAIWDERLQQLLFAVARFGFKTIYWNLDDRKSLPFASRVGAVRAAQDAPAQIDPSAITQFLLFSVVPAPLTIFKGIARLSPGFVLTFNKDAKVATRRYWDLEYKEDTARDKRE